MFFFEAQMLGLQEDAGLWNPVMGAPSNLMVRMPGHGSAEVRFESL